LRFASLYKSMLRGSQASQRHQATIVPWTRRIDPALRAERARTIAVTLRHHV
jgi:hypothetical protein